RQLSDLSRRRHGVAGLLARDGSSIAPFFHRGRRPRAEERSRYEAQETSAGRGDRPRCARSVGLRRRLLFADGAEPEHAAGAGPNAHSDTLLTEPGAQSSYGLAPSGCPLASL